MAKQNQRILLEQALMNQRDNAIKAGDLTTALALDDFLGNSSMEGIEGIESIRQTPEYKKAFRIADAVYSGNRDFGLEPLEEPEDRVYGDLGPQEGVYQERRQRIRNGKANELNIALYQAARTANIAPEKAYENLEAIRRLLVEQRMISSVTVKKGLRESVYSSDERTTAKVVKTFTQCYERGRKLSQK